MKIIWIDTSKLKNEDKKLGARDYIGPAIELDEETIEDLRDGVSVRRSLTTMFITGIDNKYVKVVAVYNTHGFLVFKCSLHSYIAEKIIDTLRKRNETDMV